MTDQVCVAHIRVSNHDREMTVFSKFHNLMVGGFDYSLGAVVGV